MPHRIKRRDCASFVFETKTSHPMLFRLLRPSAAGFTSISAAGTAADPGGEASDHSQGTLGGS
jgi:hypothetical protein